jgi:hypothetical protein
MCSLRVQKEDNPSWSSICNNGTNHAKQSNKKDFGEHKLKQYIHEHGMEWSVQQSFLKIWTIWVMHWRVAFRKNGLPIFRRLAPYTKRVCMKLKLGKDILHKGSITYHWMMGFPEWNGKFLISVIILASLLTGRKGQLVLLSFHLCCSYKVSGYYK